MALLTIIVAAYNEEKYISRCLSSIKNQTLRDLEVICINDGSTDSTQKIIQNFVNEDERFILINQEKSGLAKSRNVGLSKCHSEYVTFLDSDDWIEKDTYSYAVSKLIDVDLVIFGTVVEDEYGFEIKDDYYCLHYSDRIELTDSIRCKTNVNVWNKLYKMKIINENNISFPSAELYEDYYFYWIYVSLCNTAYYDKNIYHHYCRHPGSLMWKTYNGWSKALEQLNVLDSTFKQLDKIDRLSNHKTRNLDMFWYSFWFSFNNVTNDKKQFVLKKAKTINKKWISSYKTSILLDMMYIKHWYHSRIRNI